jgi:hypothetical protein
MSVIRTDAFSKTIRHAFASDGMFEEIRGPVRQLMAATDELSLEDIPMEEEVNDQVFVMGDDEEEEGMMKVLFDDDSDDHGDDDSDDGEYKRINTAVKKAHDLSRKKSMCFQGNSSFPGPIYTINTRINSNIFNPYCRTCLSFFSSNTNYTCSEAQSSSSC